MEQIGPLELLVVGFDDPQVDGSVLSELVSASDSGGVLIAQDFLSPEALIALGAGA